MSGKEHAGPAEPRPPGRQEAAMSEGERLGEVIHYYDKVQVAVLRLTRGVKLGDRMHFRGAHTDFEQQADSLQVDHAAVTQAGAGSEVAVKVDQRVRKGDEVFRVE
jgi:hypothetical protein